MRLFYKLLIIPIQMNSFTMNNSVVAFSARGLKENEHIIHGKLCDNLRLLSLIYPTTKEFDSIFTKDMLIKNNKAAFQQVTYYLLNSLNPSMVHQKITSWPLYDVKMESTFRNEVIACFNDIRCIYKHIELPNILASNLISPGGYKVINFMLSLSILVIHETLLKDERSKMELLTPIRCHKNINVTNIMLTTMESKIKYIENQIQFEEQNFRNYLEEASRLANIIVEDQTVAEKELVLASKELAKNKMNFKIVASPEIHHMLNECKGKQEYIRTLYITSEKCLKCLSDLLQSNNIEFHKCNLKSSSFLNGDSIDLQLLFKSLFVLVDNLCLDTPCLSDQCVKEFRKVLSDMIRRNSYLESKCSSHKNELKQLREIINRRASSIEFK